MKRPDRTLPDDWMQQEIQRGLRDRSGQIIDDPDQQGFGWGETLNLRTAEQLRGKAEPTLFDLTRTDGS